MIKLFSRNLLTFLGALVGTIGGYIYYSNIGCNAGTCAISSSLLNSCVYGMVMGGLFFSLFQKNNK